MSTSDVDVDVDVNFKIILRITPRALETRPSKLDTRDK